MSINLLSHISAFNTGSDLWILSQLEKSQWTRKLDWHLNFQIGRAVKHKVSKISPVLKKIIDDTEFHSELKHLDKTAPPANPLMIVPGDLVPTKHILIIDLEKDLGSWIRQILSIWNGLDYPTLRIFIPQDIEIETFNKEWETAQADRDVFVVVN